MNWKLKFAISIFILLIGFTSLVFAWGDGEIHNSDLTFAILGGPEFGSIGESSYIGEAKSFYSNNRYALALANAAYLTLDYKASDVAKGPRAYQSILDIGVSGLPTLDEMSVNSGDHVNSHHQKYSHKGWNYNDYGNEDQQYWGNRRLILVKTVAKIFDFGFFDELGAINAAKKAGKGKSSSAVVSKADSLSAIIYYTHLLGDIAGDSALSSGDRCDFSFIKSELKKYMFALFGEFEVKKQGSFYALLTAPAMHGTLQYELLQNDAKTLMKYFQSAFGELISNEKWFTESEFGKQVEEYKKTH